jgi:hypothetical protein
MPGILEIAAIGLTSLTVGTADLPTTATSYDGVERDISRFYSPDAPTVDIGGVVYFDSGSVLQAGLNTGYETSKLSVSPSLRASFSTKPFDLGNDWSVKGSISASISARTSHTSCKDSFSREYYCGNLTAWSDFDSKETESKFNVDYVGINFTKTF